MNQALISQGDLAGVMEAALATGLLSKTVTIQSAVDSIGPSGFPSTTFTDVSGMVDLPCQLAVMSRSEERRVGKECRL